MPNHLWTKAVKKVNDPGRMTRIAHSSTMYGARRSKGATAYNLTSYIATGHIPIPMIGNLVATVSDTVMNKIKTSMTEKSIANSLGPEVKKELKNTDPESLERFLTKARKALESFNERKTTGMNSGAPCNDVYELFHDYHYATRRVEKLLAIAEAYELLAKKVKDSYLPIKEQLDRMETPLKNVESKLKTLKSAPASTPGGMMMQEMAKGMGGNVQEQVHALCDKKNCVLKNQ